MVNYGAAAAHKNSRIPLCLSSVFSVSSVVKGFDLKAISGIPTYSTVFSFTSSGASACIFRERNQLMYGKGRSTLRLAAINSAVIATAISSGVIAPMSRPTGA
jgi:hypothetical protein